MKDNLLIGFDGSDMRAAVSREEGKRTLERNVALPPADHATQEEIQRLIDSIKLRKEKP